MRDEKENVCERERERERAYFNQDSQRRLVRDERT